MKKRNSWCVPPLMIVIPTTMITLIISQASAETGPTAFPDWLEPRGLSVIELVGQVPETYLQGMIISYDDGEGIAVYESGTRVGNTVMVTTTLYPRFSTPDWATSNKLTSFGCLGQPPRYDHMGSVVPTSTLRVYDTNGTDRTSEIKYMYITDMNTQKPSSNSGQYSRYPEDVYGTWGGTPLPPMELEGLTIPTNSGCRIEIPGVDYYPLTGVFTLNLDSSAQVSVLGSQEDTFHSYIGPGDVGIFQPLMNQLRNKYPDRHERIPLSIPTGADYFLVKFPPMPGDAYTDQSGDYQNNASRPSAGTYRLSSDQVGGGLSADLTFSAAFPLYAVWRDADYVPGDSFLPSMETPTKLAPPEYVLPAGISYNNCFTQGNCSNSVLEEIYNQAMTLEIIYLSVTKPTGLQRVPLQMAGPGWSASALGIPQAVTSPSERPITVADTSIHASDTITYYVYLPFVSKAEDRTGCPCGWFDGLGRMLDYTPGP